jgi:hypothetical protein
MRKVTPQTIVTAVAVLLAALVVGITVWHRPASPTVSASPSPSSAAGPQGETPGAVASNGLGGPSGPAIRPSAGPTGRPGSTPTSGVPTPRTTSYPDIQITEIKATCTAMQARMTFSVVSPTGAPSVRSIQVFIDNTAAALNPQPTLPTRRYQGDATGTATSHQSRWNVQVFDETGREFGLGTPTNC